MMRIAFALVSLALLVTPTRFRVTYQPVQLKCNLTEANSPTVRGLQLGMTVDQIVSVFPLITRTKEEKAIVDKAKSTTGNETVYLTFDSSTAPNKEKFAGVGSVSAGFYRARVKDLAVQYVGVTWTNVDDWVTKLSEAFNLPALQAWDPGPAESPNKILKCNGIEIEAAIQGGGASIRISETGSANRENLSVDEQRKRREFKPQ